MIISNSKYQSSPLTSPSLPISAAPLISQLAMTYVAQAFLTQCCLLTPLKQKSEISDNSNSNSKYQSSPLTSPSLPISAAPLISQLAMTYVAQAFLTQCCLLTPLKQKSEISDNSNSNSKYQSSPLTSPLLPIPAAPIISQLSDDVCCTRLSYTTLPFDPIKAPEWRHGWCNFKRQITQLTPEVQRSFVVAVTQSQGLYC